MRSFVYAATFLAFTTLLVNNFEVTLHTREAPWCRMS